VQQLFRTAVSIVDDENILVTDASNNNMTMDDITVFLPTKHAVEVIPKDINSETTDLSFDWLLSYDPTSNASTEESYVEEMREIKQQILSYLYKQLRETK